MRTALRRWRGVSSSAVVLGLAGDQCYRAQCQGDSPWLYTAGGVIVGALGATAIAVSCRQQNTAKPELVGDRQTSGAEADAQITANHGIEQQVVKESACPVMRGRNKSNKVENAGTVNAFVNAAAGSEQASTGVCPVMKKKQSPKSDTVLNGDGEAVDPSNMMPAANQDIHPGQAFKLSVDRVESTIPQSGNSGTWSYPSPQMFYNALKRKGKGDDVEEQDVQVIVDIHNNMNEITWDEVLRYEKLHEEEGPPTLLKFCGRPEELTPKARIKSWFGYGLPFDRHDWTVERGGKQVRYVIDYYHDESAEDSRPTLHSRGTVKSISIDARPALDTFEAFQDRILIAWKELGSSQTSQEVQVAPDTEELAPLVIEVDWRAGLSSTDAVLFENRIKRSCGEQLQAVADAGGKDPEADLRMQICLAGVVCPNETKRYLAAVESQQNEEESFQTVQGCLQDFTQAVRNARKTNPVQQRTT